jgi:hypothetical protein
LTKLSPNGSTRSPYQVTCGERDIHKGEFLEMVRVVDNGIKRKEVE